MLHQDLARVAMQERGREIADAIRRHRGPAGPGLVGRLRAMWRMLAVGSPRSVASSTGRRDGFGAAGRMRAGDRPSVAGGHQAHRIG